ncbi:MAG TPA: hypothetical protein VFE47_29525 [Tepidisphaeraceae bacterium]|jgi:hypothetical protein|nr:hypothetical protein [Tepidisphaeraceae bacterium]
MSHAEPSRKNWDIFCPVYVSNVPSPAGLARRDVFPKLLIGDVLAGEKDLHVPFSDRKTQKMGHFETWAMVRIKLGRQMMRDGARRRWTWRIRWRILR